MKLDSRLQEKLGELFAAPEETSIALPGALLVDISQLVTGEQPRQHFDVKALKDLENSIRELHEASRGIGGTGILQPLLVRATPQKTNDLPQFLVIAGERRLRAAKAVGLKRIPVIVEQSSEEEAWEQAIVENLLRTDLSPLEEAAALQKLMRLRGESVRQTAKRLGKDKGYLENRLFLLKAPTDVQEMVSARADTMRHAREISKVESTALRRKLIQYALSGASLNVIQEQITKFSGPHEPMSNGKVQVSARADTDALNDAVSALCEAVKQAKKAARLLPATSDKVHFARQLEQQAEELMKLAKKLDE